VERTNSPANRYNTSFVEFQNKTRILILRRSTIQKSGREVVNIVSAMVRSGYKVMIVLQHQADKLQKESGSTIHREFGMINGHLLFRFDGKDEPTRSIKVNFSPDELEERKSSWRSLEFLAMWKSVQGDDIETWVAEQQLTNRSHS